MGIYKETIRKYMVGHQMRQIVSNNGVLDLDQFYLDATAMGATQDKALFEAELNALPAIAKREAETVLVPGIYKNGKVYGFNGATKGLVEFDFSRESSATYFDKNGIMQTAAPGMPRIDHDPVTKACKGYLLEGTGVNYMLNSGSIEGSIPSSGISTVQTNWGKGSSLSEGVRIEQQGTDSFFYKYVDKEQFAQGTRVVFSFFIKMSDSSVPVAGVDFNYVIWNGFAEDVKAIPLGGGVYRMSGRAIKADQTNSIVGVVKTPYNSNRTFTVTGLQFEPDELTSYIPTGNSMSIRSAETLKSSSDIIQYNAASVYMDFTPLRRNPLSAAGGVYLIKGNYVTLYSWADSSIKSEIGSISVDSPIPFTHGARIKAVSSYNSGHISLNLNGGAVSKNILQTTPSHGTLVIAVFGSNLIGQHTKSLAIFSRQLTDQEHTEITS